MPARIGHHASSARGNVSVAHPKMIRLPPLHDLITILRALQWRMSADILITLGFGITSQPDLSV